MSRISIIISEIYTKYLPLAEKASIQLNLDIAEPNKEVPDSDDIKVELEKHLKSALKRTAAGEIKIKANKGQIIIQDSGTTLSPTACALLSRGRIKAKSRVGFGTTVSIDLTNKTTAKSSKSLPF